MKRTIGMAIAAAYLAFMPAQAEAAGASAEITPLHESTTLDVKVGGKLSERGGFFLRNRATVDYEGNVSNMTLADLNFKLVDGLRMVTQPQFTNAPYLRGGLQYMGKFGNLKAIQYALGGLNLDKLTPSIKSVSVLEYAPKFNKIVGLYTRFENISYFGKDGHNLSLQQLRVGPSFGRFSIGAAADFQEVGNEGDFSYNVGGFVGAQF